MAEPIILTTTASTHRILGYPLIALALILAFAAGIKGAFIAAAIVAACVWFYIKLGKARVTLDATGVTREGMFGTTSIRWDEVKRYRFLSMDPTQNMHAAQGGLIVALAIAAAKAIAKKPNNRVMKAGRLTLHGD